VSNPFAQEEGPQPPQILKTPIEVFSSLRPLLESRTPLMIQFSGRSQRYQTFLVDINREQGWIAIDELIPNDGDRLMKAGEAFHVEGFHEGVRIAWDNEHPVHEGQLNDAPCYWVPLPTQILYHQRRNAYRAQLSGLTVPVTLGGSKLSVPLQGLLVDMSATGCKLSFKGNVQGRLHAGEVYEEFSAKLPFGTITSEIELRHAVYDEKRDTTYCGIRFHRISGLTQRHVERFVYQLQREARRDQASDRF